ncbi:LytTR family transcriptional regulator DNA-binding domain-containing protein [bacterium]|nr:LytTR family transcriptional regulator DNA-binding domain-containing protein [bacterium]
MIEIKRLQKISQGTTVLDIEEVSILSGEIVAVIGPTGSGITTLFDILLGKTQPSAGEARLNGFDPLGDKAEINSQVGVQFKNNALYQDQTAERNLRFFAQLHGLAKLRSLEVLQQIGLADQADTPVRDLTSGLARRLTFGRAILTHPTILILNHPFEQCDSDSIHWLKRLIREQAEGGAAILILDESAENLEDLCDRILTLRDGRIDAVHAAGEQPSGLPFKIPVKLDGRVALLNPGDILYAEAAEGRTILKTSESELPSQFTLSELEERLKRSGFFRAHRSFLVNLQHVRDVIPYSRNSYSLRLDDADRTEIPLSKNAAAGLRELLDY